MINWHTIMDFIAQWYWVPLTLMYVGVIITILSENRKPSKSLAYILVIVFLPVVGLLVYYFVGKKPVFKKLVFDRKRLVDKQKMDEYYEQLSPKWKSEFSCWKTILVIWLFHSVTFIYQNQSLISIGNAVTLLNNGEEKFPALFTALENARSHIHMEYYIFTPDDVGNRIADILINKHKEGVEVRVIVDDVGSNHIKNTAKKI